MSGECVSRRPFASHTNSSIVSQPAPCTKPPSTCPRAMPTLMASPQSCRMSMRNTSHHAGEFIHFDLAHRRADREIMKRFATATCAIEMNLRRGVKSRRAQAGPREIGALQQLGERESRVRLSTFTTMLSLNTIRSIETGAPFFSESISPANGSSRARNVSHAFFTAAPLRSGPAGGGGRGGVRHLVRARGHDADPSARCPVRARR